MRAPATKGVEYPSPRSFTCQSNFGPSAGHCLSSPLSFDTPLRSGPRHCGQSAATVPAVNKQRTTLAITVRDFMFSPSETAAELGRGEKCAGRALVLLSYDYDREMFRCCEATSAWRGRPLGQPAPRGQLTTS